MSLTRSYLKKKITSQEGFHKAYLLETEKFCYVVSLSHLPLVLLFACVDSRKNLLNIYNNMLIRPYFPVEPNKDS